MPEIDASKIPDELDESVVPEAHADPTVQKFLREHASESAVITLTGRQIFFFLVYLAAALVLYLRDWKIFLTVLNFVVSGFYLVVILYKLLTVLLSLLHHWEIRIKPEEIAELEDEDLPVYTILLPMYKEHEVAHKIVTAALSVDYPRDKLDVLLLLEEDDLETRKALEKVHLPDCVRQIIIPDSQPKTKPKACNHGLQQARGEYVVIFDAEDRPEPDQLKKAVAAFRRLPEKIVCLQAKLNYYNPRQNYLTRWFTMEYSVWFDLFLPGLHALGVPIPLGGTSNHFKTSALRELGGWDPFNVTEDCDLGIRLYKHGFKTRVMDSTTFEEANSKLGNWIRQRSRWVKGYIQTHLVHTRRFPMGVPGLWRLGPRGYLSFLLTVGGLSLMLLLNPIYWAIGIYYLSSPWQMWYENYVDAARSVMDPWSVVSQVFWYVTVTLLVSNAVFILINVLGCIRRKLYDLIPWALVSPIYWIFISLAAWKGFLQLFTKAHFWEKTLHGLDHPGGNHHADVPAAEETGAD
ncbi:MAG: glycosyltransferase [Planctomycetes bacterium]|nr:glycosyltransferase [Planctomycetota bacterium]